MMMKLLEGSSCMSSSGQKANGSTILLEHLPYRLSSYLELFLRGPNQLNFAVEMSEEITMYAPVRTGPPHHLPPLTTDSHSSTSICSLSTLLYIDDQIS
jgi:hypothetical protein